MFKSSNKDIITISMDTVVTMFDFEHVFVLRSKLSSFTKKTKSWNMQQQDLAYISFTNEKRIRLFKIIHIGSFFWFLFLLLLPFYSFFCYYQFSYSNYFVRYFCSFWWSIFCVFCRSLVNCCCSNTCSTSCNSLSYRHLC